MIIAYILYKLSNFGTQSFWFYYNNNIQLKFIYNGKKYKPQFKHSATGSFYISGGSFN